MGPNIMRRSGSGLMGVNKFEGNISVSVLEGGFCVEDVPAREVGGGEGDGEEADWQEVSSLISASMSFVLMSWADSFPDCDISVRVLVKSTRVSRPSEWESKRIVRLCFFGVLEGDDDDDDFEWGFGA